MSGVQLAWQQVRVEQQAFWRRRSRALVSYLMPVVILALLASMNGRAKMADGTRYVAFLVPGVLAWGIVASTFSILSVHVALLCDTGVLKRLRGTPLPRWSWLVGCIGSAAVSALVLTGVVLTLGLVGYGVEVPLDTLPGLLVTLTLGTACFVALGIGVVRVIPDAATAPAVVGILVLPVLFVSGVFGPTSQQPAWLVQIGDLLPIAPLSAALHHAFEPSAAGPGFDGDSLAVLGLWTLAGVALTMAFLHHETTAA